MEPQTFELTPREDAALVELATALADLADAALPRLTVLAVELELALVVDESGPIASSLSAA